MLDFDGVLHPDPCYDEVDLFANRLLLEEVLREFANVDVVITSTWRLKYSLENLKHFFVDDLASRFIGVTPQWFDYPILCDIIGPTYLREIEILAWLRESAMPWRQWVALDDKKHWFRPFCKNLIACDPAVGMQRDVQTQLCRYLSG